MLKLIFIRLNTLTEKLLAEEQAGFRLGQSTVEQIFNSRIITEKHLEHQDNLFTTSSISRRLLTEISMQACGRSSDVYTKRTDPVVQVIQELYENSSSKAVLLNEQVGRFFRGKVGVHKGCLLSETKKKIKRH